MEKKPGVRQRLGFAVSKHHQFPRLGRRFPSSWKPQVPRAVDSVETPSFQRAVKTWKPAVSVGGETWKPQFSRARARPSAVRREMETPISPACFPRGRGRTRKPQVPQAWAGFYAVPRHGNLGFPRHGLAAPLAAVARKPQISRPQERKAFLRCEQKKRCLNEKDGVEKGATAIVVRILNKVTRAKLRIEATKG